MAAETHMNTEIIDALSPLLNDKALKLVKESLTTASQSLLKSCCGTTQSVPLCWRA